MALEYGPFRLVAPYVSEKYQPLSRFSTLHSASARRLRSRMAHHITRGVGDFVKPRCYVAVLNDSAGESERVSIEQRQGSLWGS